MNKGTHGKPSKYKSGILFEYVTGTILFTVFLFVDEISRDVHSIERLIRALRFIRLQPFIFMPQVYLTKRLVGLSVCTQWPARALLAYSKATSDNKKTKTRLSLSLCLSPYLSRLDQI